MLSLGSSQAVYPVYRSDSSRNNRVMRLRSGRDKVEEETGHILTHGNKIEYLKASIDSPPGISLRRQPQAAAHMPINNKPQKGKKPNKQEADKSYIYTSLAHMAPSSSVCSTQSDLSPCQKERKEKGESKQDHFPRHLARARRKKSSFCASVSSVIHLFQTPPCLLTGGNSRDHIKRSHRQQMKREQECLHRGPVQPSRLESGIQR